MSFQSAHRKTLNVCGPIILFYGPAIFTSFIQQFGFYILSHIHILSCACILVPPMLNLIIYGIGTKQIREQVTHILFPKAQITLEDDQSF